MFFILYGGARHAKLYTSMPRDKDGYHWLTGRVDDVINVRYFLDSISFAHIIFYVLCV